MFEAITAKYEALFKEDQMTASSRQIARHLARAALYELKGFDALYPDTRDKIEKLVGIMAQKGRPVILSEGFRTATRQDQLYGQVPKVTNAKGLQSWHQMGIAADLIFKDYAWSPPSDTWWTDMGEEAEKLGLVWGGRWASPDRPHVQDTLSSGLGVTPSEELQAYFRL